MPRVIGQNRIPRVSIGNRNLNFRSGDPLGVGFLYQIVDVSVAGPGVFTAPVGGVAFVYAWGAGGSGSTLTGLGGGAGGGVYKRIPMLPGQTIQYDLGVAGPGAAGAHGNNGTATVVNGPGAAMVAGFGSGGGPGLGLGGDGTGGDVNSKGGNGGNGGAGQAGADGGGAGGAAAGADGAGGGQAGFNSITKGLTMNQGGVAGGTSNAPATTGSGSKAANSSNGGSGKILIYFFKQP